MVTFSMQSFEGLREQNRKLRKKLRASLSEEDSARFIALGHLADELCAAIDNAASDIGGSRPIKEILAEFGPAVDKVEAVLKRNPREKRNA